MQARDANRASPYFHELFSHAIGCHYHGGLRVCATNMAIRSVFLKNVGASGEASVSSLHAVGELVRTEQLRERVGTHLNTFKSVGMKCTNCALRFGAPARTFPIDRPKPRSHWATLPNGLTKSGHCYALLASRRHKRRRSLRTARAARLSFPCEAWIATRSALLPQNSRAL